MHNINEDIGIYGKVLSFYGIDNQGVVITPHGSGLINNTWKVHHDDQDYILQRINQQVFRNPDDIAGNIRLIADYLSEHHPEYIFPTPVKTRGLDEMVYYNGDYFRLFPFMTDSYTIDTVDDPVKAFEAARQFGLFTKLLSDFPVNQLKVTIPDFHNLSYRYYQFEESLLKGNPERKKRSADAIAAVRSNDHLVAEFQNISKNKAFKSRVTHHDTKISNVLFDKNGKGLCVIDLDTVMPGYFISDVGDMMRTYLSSVSEDEKHFEKIEVREDFFKAIASGYLGIMGNELSKEETGHFIYAGKFMIYMQAVRFLTDYLNSDRYYGAKYEDHNFVRANNQLNLLARLTEKEELLAGLINAAL